MALDVNSYGIANQSNVKQKTIPVNVLGTGVESQYRNVKERIDSVEEFIFGSIEMANTLIIKDAINIMKANAKLNVIIQSKKYKMANMIFDDLLDLSGINITKSNNYQHDSVLGIIKSVNTDRYIITTLNELSDTLITNIILTVDKNHTSNASDYIDTDQYEVSCDAGITWSRIQADTLFIVDPLKRIGSQLQFRFNISGDTELLSYAYTWSS